MTDERKLSTSDIAAAVDQRTEAGDDRERAERERVERDRHHALAETPRQKVEEAMAPLFSGEELIGYKTRWSGIQTGFVDEPRNAVKEADTLVAEVMKRLADLFADERKQLEAKWEQSDRLSTEELRIAMRRYRSFFERLLSI